MRLAWGRIEDRAIEVDRRRRGGSVDAAGRREEGAVAASSQSNARALARSCRIEEGRAFRLARVDPAETGGVRGKAAARTALAEGVEELAALQERLYAQNRWALLLLFQAMDAGGKDSAIKHVFSGLNPQGCQVSSFREPSPEELDHDYLWRTAQALPERGRIGIFNRSWYEEVLIVRLHPELLERQKLPRALVTDRIWAERYEDIRAFERYLTRNGIVIRKFFLHVSLEEQRRRFLDRLQRPEKHWKFSRADVEERRRWDDYQRAYEEAVRNTATPWAPWHVVPADHKWFAHLVVAGAILEALDGLDLAFPEIGEARKKEIEAARALLRAKESGSRAR
jgi:PPK2 family polyphosphate:nucleotide phosphotransferase